MPKSNLDKKGYISSYTQVLLHHWGTSVQQINVGKWKINWYRNNGVMIFSNLLSMFCSPWFFMETNNTFLRVRCTYPNQSLIKQMYCRFAYRKILFVQNWYNTIQHNWLIINLSHSFVLINCETCWQNIIYFNFLIPPFTKNIDRYSILEANPKI